MTKLLKYLKSYEKESILGPLFKLLEASFELMIPIVMARIIDIGIKERDLNYIWKMCLIMIALGIIGLICSLTAQYFAAKAAVGFATNLRKDLFRHIQQLSYSEIDEIGTSTLIARMTNDINQVQSGVNLVLRLFLRSPFIVIGAMLMAFTINVKAALIFVVTIPLLTIVVFGIMFISIPLYKKVQKRLDGVLKVTRENLTGVRVIRAFQREESEKINFEHSSKNLMDIQLFVGRISALLNPITYVIINGAIIVLIWVGAIQVEVGIITQGAVIALVNYMSQILTELIKLANLIITFTKSLACANRIQSIFETESTLVEPTNPTDIKNAANIDKLENKDDILVFDHVSFTYKNAKEESLSDIHFTVKKGQTIGIIGGTGSGKSSLVNLIPRFYDATKGNVRFHGGDVKRYSFDELRDKIGVVPQKAVLFRGTIEDNLRWGKKDATLEDMEKAITYAQAKEFIDSKEDGLNTMIHQGGKNLSGGQRQRLTIARALIKEPEILILDDSSSALDYATDAKLRRSIKEMNEDITVFIVSQRPTSIQYADQIIVLEDGHMAGLGTHEELLQHCEVYQEIYYSQFPKEAKVNG